MMIHENYFSSSLKRICEKTFIRLLEKMTFRNRYIKSNMNRKKAAEMRNPWERFPVTSPYQKLNENIRNMAMAKMDKITEIKVSR